MRVVINVTTNYYEGELGSHILDVSGDINEIPFVLGNYNFDSRSVRTMFESLGFEVCINKVVVFHGDTMFND